MTIKILVDEYMLEHNEQDLLGILKSEGFDVKVGKYIPFAKKEEVPTYFPLEECVIVYGTLEFVQQQQSKGYIPGGYLQLKNMECAHYVSQINQPHLLLNEEHVLTSFQDFVRRRDFFFRAFNTDELFIRPNSGLKIFTGLTLNQKNSDEEINALRQLSSVNPETLILVAPAQKIEAEYRFFINNRKVITGSCYQKEGQVHLSAEVPIEAVDAARKMAQNPWQPDIVYVCDIAKTPNGYKLIELNAASTSGLYMANIPKLFDSWVNVAYLEYVGEISLGDLAPPIENLKKHKI